MGRLTRKLPEETTLPAPACKARSLPSRRHMDEDMRMAKTWRSRGMEHRRNFHLTWFKHSVSLGGGGRDFDARSEQPGIVQAVKSPI
jgi:hypothetical protein